MTRFLLPLTIVLALSTMFVRTDAQELVTDRPDQTESSSVVPAGRLQVESGLLHESAGTSGEPVEQTRTSFGTLLRLGLTERFELRFTAAHVRSSGFEDVAVGTKVAVTSEEGLIPETALLLHVGLPVNTSPENPFHSVIDFRFSMSHSLSDRLSLSYNLGVESSNQENHGAGIYTLALGADLFETIGGYIEIFGRLGVGRAPEHAIDGGATWSPIEALQFDISAGIGFQPTNAPRFLGVGISFRLPK